MSAAIEEAISNHNKVLVSVLEKLKDLHSKYVCINPADIRKSYDVMQDFIESRISEINERKELIKKCIKDLEECNKPIEEMVEVLKKIGITSNDARQGTLFGLCKQTIKENDITMDEIEKMVSDFPYDEQNEIKKYTEQNDNNDNNDNNINGGKNKFSKRNNTKRKNYRAKNGNKKSKNGVLYQ